MGSKCPKGYDCLFRFVFVVVFHIEVASTKPALDALLRVYMIAHQRAVILE